MARKKTAKGKQKTGSDDAAKGRSVGGAGAIRIEYPPGPLYVRRALIVIAALYILLMFMEGVGATMTGLVYQPILLFCQTAGLFPRAATHSIDYRVQGYTCSGSVVEIDYRPFFPIHADDKENRFSRAMHFGHGDRVILEALEAYIMREYNRAASDKIGGVSIISLNVPVPPLGTTFPRDTRKALSDYPKDVRKVAFVTPHDTVLQRCRAGGL